MLEDIQTCQSQVLDVCLLRLTLRTCTRWITYLAMIEIASGVVRQADDM